MFSERLKNLRKEKKISQLKLSQNLKLGRSTITQYETGSRTPDYQTLLKIAQYFSVSVDYLLGYSPLIPEDEQSSLYVAGTDLPYKKLNENKAANEDDLFLFSVLDDSMKNARIITGDWVVVKKQKDFENGDIILLSLNKEEKPMIRKAAQKDNMIILHTDNPEYPTVSVNASKVEVIGRVVEVRFQV